MAPTVTKEHLKQKIDRVQDEYLDMLYQIIEVFEASSPNITPSDQLSGSTVWLQFIEETYGSFQDDPLTRGPQGAYEIREVIE